MFGTKRSHAKAYYKQGRGMRRRKKCQIENEKNEMGMSLRLDARTPSSTVAVLWSRVREAPTKDPKIDDYI